MPGKQIWIPFHFVVSKRQCHSTLVLSDHNQADVSCFGPRQSSSTVSSQCTCCLIYYLLVLRSFMHACRLNAREIFRGQGVNEEETMPGSQRKTGGTFSSTGVRSNPAGVRFNVGDNKVRLFVFFVGAFRHVMGFLFALPFRSRSSTSRFLVRSSRTMISLLGVMKMRYVVSFFLRLLRFLLIRRVLFSV